ncbi:MAG: LysR family transcriptional regulator [Pseudomonadota bacterium]
MDWRDIPSLAALRAFEAAARLKSYSAAARGLNVTHAAVAQHVRALEERFGLPLMVRSGRGMVATVEGAQLADALGRGFAEIAGGVRALDEAQADGPLCLTTTRTFAENWLAPRLPRFWSSHADITLAISTGDAVIDLRQEGFHMAIRYSTTGQWPGYDARYLTSGRTVLVGHPDLAARVDGNADLLAEIEKLPWLIETDYTDFKAWMAAQGIVLDRVRATYLKGNPLVLSATRAGAGVSMQPTPVVADDLEAGRLVAILNPGEDGPGYYLVTPQGPASDRVRIFEKWLRSEIGESDAAARRQTG